MNKLKRPSRFSRMIDRFLSHKRALGHRYDHEAWVLRKLQRHVEQSSWRDLNAKSFESWLATLKDHHPNTRRKWYQIVCYFCAYRRYSEPGCFVPLAENAPKHRPYVTPIILEPEQIGRMLGIASKLAKTRKSPLRAPTLRLALVLLYTCGLRLGELLRLTMNDIEERGTVLHIRESKFHKSRLVPLSPSATRELHVYLQKRRRVFAVAPNTPLLCNCEGGYFHSYSPVGLRNAFNRLFDAAAVRDAQGRRPRVHDLRHSFAVQALLRWYRKGTDVQSQLPKLAIFMGHVSITSSLHYLHWVPSLQRLASHRFEQRFGHLVKKGGQ